MEEVGKIYCDENILWSENGRCYSNYTTNIYKPPVVDWAAMPAWARWVAQNADGSWWWFVKKPEMVSDTVTHDNGGRIEDGEGILEDGERIPEEYAPSYSGPWWDSLVERPAESEAD